jgi:hypothetical protein
LFREGQPEFNRFMGDAVLLPDGNVLVVNGAGRGAADCSTEAVMQAELFDSENESWTTLAKINRRRMYHSCAILLPDASAVISGNTRHWNPDNAVEEGALEIFSPPYLFQKERPQIRNVPGSLSYNTTLQISHSPSPNVDRVSLMRPSSNTHTNNMEQRLVTLEVESRRSDKLTARTPRDATVAPPGYYMLFLVSKDGVPSRCAWLHLD